jgi:aerobic-type carbon monoxide dehydrogenase small subunit (CoxS/CutS family)
MEKTLACTTTVSAIVNQHIYTVESIAQGTTLSPLQKSFLESFAFQCGYCTPGFLMAATAMLDHLKHNRMGADELEATIQTWVGGNLCRCTGYVKYLEAIRKVARAQIDGGA